MKICVLVKEVPDAAVTKRLDPATGLLDRSGEKNLNPYDTHAIEAAMQLKEGGANEVEEIVAVTMGVGMSLLFPALFSAAMAGVPDDQRSHAVGTFSLFFDLANGLGAPVLGLVVALTSYQGAFAAAALVGASGVFAQVSLSRRRAAAAAG